MKNQKKQNGGITLIALVITVIVLLILAGVCITMLTGENGILNQATKAKENTESASLQEEVTLVLNEKTTDELVEGEEKEITEYLNKIEEATVEKNEQVGDLYYVSKNNATVSVYDDGTIYEGKIDVWDGESYEVPEFDELFNWHIYNCAQMNYFAKYQNGELTEDEMALAEPITSDTIVYLENDLDLGGRQIDGEATENSTYWESINANTINFDGNNHTILGLYGEGLFGTITTISNLTIKNGYVEGNGNIGSIVNDLAGSMYNCHNVNTTVKQNSNSITGGLVGILINSGIIENCSNTGKVINGNGGILGGTFILGSNMNVSIKNCSNTGEVYCSGVIGGIVGTCRYIFSGSHDGNSIEISNCYNRGTIVGTGERVGGIAGETLTDAEIKNCYNTGNVTGESNNVGGIAGIIFGDVTNSYNKGTITGVGQVGGIVGQIGTDCEANIRECYNIGSVTGTGEAIGGIIGWTSVTDTSGTIERNYNSGQVSGTGNIGGIIGRSANTFVVTNCYNKGTVSGTTQIGSVIGKQETNSDNLSNLYYLNTLPNVAVGGKEDTGTIKSIENDFNSLEEFLNWVDESGD